MKSIYFTSLVVCILLIPVFIDLLHPSDDQFPRKIFNGMIMDTISRTNSSAPIKRQRKEGNIGVFVFYDKGGKLIQKIYGTYIGESYCNLYDIDGDNIPELFLWEDDVSVL